MADALYEQDFIAWTEQQARLLRGEAARGSNRALDWENLAEEVEGLGRSERRELSSQLRRIMEHLWKLEFSPAVEPRAGWRGSIANARAEMRTLLRSDPGLRPRIPDLILEEAADAADLAIEALRSHGENIQTLISHTKSGRTYSEAQILGDWFPDRPDLPPLR